MKIKLDMYLKTRGLLRKDIKVIKIEDVKVSLEVTGKVVVVEDNEIINYKATADLQLYITTKKLLADIKERVVKYGK